MHNPHSCDSFDIAPPPASPAPLVQVGRVDTFDPDQHADTVEPWHVRFDQLSTGRFRGRTDFVHTERVTVYRERWNRRVAAIGQTPVGYTTIGTTVSPSRQISWCGDDVSDHRLAYAARSADVDFWSPESGSEHLIVLLRSELVEEYLEDTDSLTDRPERDLRCHPMLGRELAATASSIVGRFASHPRRASDPLEQTMLESEVLNIVAACAGWGPSPGDDLVRRRDAMRRAVAYVNDRHEPITIRTLARELEVSERTLLYAFREQLDITPQMFLKRHRLNGARRDLLSAAPGSTTVTRVATSWGFCELGRFAVDYKELFGDSPSKALAESRSALRRYY